MDMGGAWGIGECGGGGVEREGGGETEWRTSLTDSMGAVWVSNLT